VALSGSADGGLGGSGRSVSSACQVLAGRDTDSRTLSGVAAIATPGIALAAFAVAARARKKVRCI
jgi:hypothetical protein